ncbi:MAG: hypothetical protein HY320_03125 [Armatimonadetes bacterium]|nr:hypothetical protein [Armatimonadota bacterium]
MTDRTLRLGAARVDITPAGPQWLDGYGNRTAPSDGVYLPIAARALLLASGQERALLVSTEVLAFDAGQARRVKAAIARTTSIPEEAIILAATHTHCAPRVCDLVMPGAVDPVYRNWFEDRLVDAACRAATAAQSIQVRIGRTEWDLGINRRLWTPSGTVMQPNPAGVIDREVTTFWFEGADGRVHASLTIHACHPTSRGGSRIGGDYPGVLMATLERDLGGIHLFALGCAGDVRPAFIGPHGGFRTAEIAEVFARGEALAERVRATRAAAIPVAGPSVRAHREWVDLPLATPPGLAELKEIAAQDASPLRRLWASRMLAELTRGPLPTSVPFEIQAVSLGDVCPLVCYAGEMVVDYALSLNARHPGAVPVAYCNGSVGYVPSRRIYPEGGYEVDGSYPYYAQPAPFRLEVEERIAAATDRLLARLATAGQGGGGEPCV